MGPSRLSASPLLDAVRSSTSSHSLSNARRVNSDMPCPSALARSRTRLKSSSDIRTALGFDGIESVSRTVIRLSTAAMFRLRFQ